VAALQPSCFRTARACFSSDHPRYLRPHPADDAGGRRSRLRRRTAPGAGRGGLKPGAGEHLSSLISSPSCPLDTPPDPSGVAVGLQKAAPSCAKLPPHARRRARRSHCCRPDRAATPGRPLPLESGLRDPVAIAPVRMGSLDGGVSDSSTGVVGRHTESGRSTPRLRWRVEQYSFLRPVTCSPQTEHSALIAASSCTSSARLFVEAIASQQTGCTTSGLIASSTSGSSLGSRPSPFAALTTATA